MGFNVPRLRDSNSCKFANRCFIGGQGGNMRDIGTEGQRDKGT
jgi:hypothetical protein